MSGGTYAASSAPVGIPPRSGGSRGSRLDLSNHKSCHSQAASPSHSCSYTKSDERGNKEKEKIVRRVGCADRVNSLPDGSPEVRELARVLEAYAMPFDPSVRKELRLELDGLAEGANRSEDVRALVSDVVTYYELD